MQQTNLLGYGGYFLMGAVIAASPRGKIPTFLWALVFGFSVAVTYFLTFSFSNTAGNLIETAYIYFSPNVLIASIAAFVIFTRLKLDSRYAPLLARLADLSFLVYFMHVVIVDKIAKSDFIAGIAPSVPDFVSVLLIAIGTYCISLTICRNNKIAASIQGNIRLIGRFKFHFAPSPFHRPAGMIKDLFEHIVRGRTVADFVARDSTIACSTADRRSRNPVLLLGRAGVRTAGNSPRAEPIH